MNGVKVTLGVEKLLIIDIDMSVTTSIFTTANNIISWNQQAYYWLNKWIKKVEKVGKKNPMKLFCNNIETFFWVSWQPLPEALGLTQTSISIVQWNTSVKIALTANLWPDLTSSTTAVRALISALIDTSYDHLCSLIYLIKLVLKILNV